MPPQTAWIVQKAFWRQEKAAFYAQNGAELSTQVTQDGYSAVDAELVAEYVAKAQRCRKRRAAFAMICR